MPDELEQRRPGRPRRRRLHGSIIAVALVAISAAGAAAPGAGAGARPTHRATEITRFRPGQFPEGLAVDGRGRAFVSVTTFGPKQRDPGAGHIVRVSRSGTKKRVGPRFRVGLGVLTGVAVDRRGRLFVASASARARNAPGVWRLSRHGRRPTRVLSLGGGSFPNGLALRGGSLYVSDSARGAIYRVGRSGRRSVWAKDGLLAPRKTFGANGIAFHHHSLYVAVTDSGRIVRVPVEGGGRAGEPVVVAHREALRGADGITFDRHGRLLVATSSTNRLLRLSPDGRLRRVAGEKEGLRYPTTPAFDGRRSRRLDLVNGDLFGTARPSLVALRVR